MISITGTQLASIKSSSNTSFYIVITKRTAGNWADGYSKHIYSQRQLTHSSAISGARYIANRMNKKSIRDASYGVEEKKRGSLGKVGSLSFTIADEDHFVYGLNQAGTYYEGCKVELWFCFESSAAGASDILWWSGEVDDVGRDPVEGITVISCATLDGRYSKTVPPNQWDEAETTMEHLRGKRKPVTIGVVELAEGLKVSNTTSPTSIFSGTYGPSIQFSDPALGAVVSIASMVYGDSGLVEATGGTAELNTALNTFSTILADCRAYMLNAAAQKLHIKLKIPLHEISAGGTQSATLADIDMEGMVDGDGLTYCDVSRAYNGSTSVFAKVPHIGVQADIPDHPSTLLPKVYLCVKIQGSAASGPVAAGTQTTAYCLVLCFADNKEDLNPQTAGPRVLLDLGTIATPTLHDHSLWAETLTFTLDGGTHSPLQTLGALGAGYICVGLRNANIGMNSTYGQIYARIFEYWGLVVYAEMEFPGDGFRAQVSGHKDDGSATVNGGSPSQIIEKPGSVAAWAARYLSAAGDNVLWSDFQAVNATRASWAFARQLMDDTDSDSMIEEIAETGLFHVWCDRNGKLRAFTTDTKPTVAFTVSRGQVINGRITASDKTPMDDVATTFTVRAKQHPLSDNWQIVLTCSPTASSAVIGSTYRDLCAAARDTYCGGREVTMDVDCDWIRDATTAREFIIELIARHTRRWWIIKFEADLDSLTAEIGDQFNFSAPGWTDLPPDIAGEQFVVTGLDLMPDKDRVRITALQTVD